MGSTNDPGRTVAMALVLGGIVAIVVGVLAGLLIEPYLYAIAAVALIDFALAWAFATGRIGTTADRRREAEATGNLAAEAEADPSFNPYARED
jgi:membrane protein implicated in regulation of membrane protease activity